MEIPSTIAVYISAYGYLAVFVLILLQETGFPNPIPNELLLLFTGYNCYEGRLSFAVVILIAVIADFTATNILYNVFYFAGDRLMKYLNRRLPVTYTKIDKNAKRIKAGGVLRIFIFRCTPFTRGYVSVISGLLRIPGRIYLPVAALTGVIWATFYVTTGYLIGPFWNQFTGMGNLLKPALILIMVSGITAITALSLIRAKKNGLSDCLNCSGK
jgi:membrane protein DedA with SNARE-associated domain